VTQTIERPVRRRRRGTAVEKAISDAVLAGLAEVGFGRLTFEGVAERAGTW
jgi:AcrR family transcriptional regulator